MTLFPCCKINLGLNIIGKRVDGYHDLESVFYPIPLNDALSIHEMDKEFPSSLGCDLKITGDTIDCDDEKNLVVKAYRLLSRDYELPRIHIHLHKCIPSQAGLGGGSADAAFMIRLLDERFHLNMGNAEMERYAAKLGADCAFFISAEPAFATGKGEVLTPVDATGSLSGYYIGIVKPNIAISTAEAYASITPRQPKCCCKDVVRQPIETWKEQLSNDFEEPLFKKYPLLADIKQNLYKDGAVYAQMSGSGSALYGIYRKRPEHFDESFKAYQHWMLAL